LRLVGCRACESFAATPFDVVAVLDASVVARTDCDAAEPVCCAVELAVMPAEDVVVPAEEPRAAGTAPARSDISTIRYELERHSRWPSPVRG
jgi:hypothetical protein